MWFYYIYDNFIFDKSLLNGLSKLKTENLPENSSSKVLVFYSLSG